MSYGKLSWFNNGITHATVVMIVARLCADTARIALPLSVILVLVGLRCLPFHLLSGRGNSGLGARVPDWATGAAATTNLAGDQDAPSLAD